MLREIVRQPLLLWTTRDAEARVVRARRAVERDHVPGTEIVAVVPLRRIARSVPEVRVIACSWGVRAVDAAGRGVVLITRDWVGE
jgi:hypothetical protein